MALSWNEIRRRAIEFSNEWKGVERERAEAQTFWNEFFEVFGISRKRVASFEEPVKKITEAQGFIDCFWKGMLITEHKSKGKNLDTAYEQALGYFAGLSETDLPKYVVVTDFEKIRLYDLEQTPTHTHEFHIAKLHEQVKLFAFIAGYSKTNFKPEDPVNIKAAELMGKLHDSLFETGFTGHELEVFLVRILFCLFADDTGIFEKGIFSEYLSNKTKVDGTDVGPQLAQLFQVLNTPSEKRLKNLDEDLAGFPYVNGKLFEEVLQMTSFDSKMREALLRCSSFDWSRISPAVFGSLFQSVMNPEIRRNLGAHYTSESNILKLIHPLFLDELWEEFEKVKTNKIKLTAFHDKLAKLTFLDPACGCGNFLVVTYRELRLLELEVLKKLYKQQTIFEINEIVKLDVDKFYGIEIEEFPARIAEVAMWLVDHQMNVLVSEEFGQYLGRLPLKKSANIVNGNALRLDWEDVIPKDELRYILGNPPFVGAMLMTKEQREDLLYAFDNLKNVGILDFVSAWYVKSAKFIYGTKIRVAFVSTNSITQGEQTGILWKELFDKYACKINFAHRTFQWNSEAKGKAAVHVVIIGFANFDIESKTIFEYEDIRGEPHKISVKNLNPYLVDAPNIIITARSNPLIQGIPSMNFGNMPAEGGQYLFTDEEKNEFCKLEPTSAIYFKKLISAKEFINGINRWCLWLNDVNPEEVRNHPIVIKRVNLVHDIRLRSSRPKLAYTPMLFAQITQDTDSPFLFLPRHSSENRKYIPIGFFAKEDISHDSGLIISNAKIYHFAVLTSEMHMTWMRYVAGRLKSDYRYSKDIVYNNFPWPEEPTEAQKKLVEDNAQAVLAVRNEFPNSTLADLYDPLTMPPKLTKAHKDLDTAVDKCYRSKPFKDERERIEFLFALYTKYTNPLLPVEKKRRGKGNS